MQQYIDPDIDPLNQQCLTTVKGRAKAFWAEGKF
jgi:hypothetical protein